MRHALRGLALALAGWSITLPVWAGNEGYFVAYNHKFKRGEKEFMFMTDFTRPSTLHREDGQSDYTSQMVEFEWQFTDRFASELMIEGYQDGRGSREYTGFRLENRFKLFKEEVLFNPVVYMEYEHLKTSTRFKMETSGWVLPPYVAPAEGEDPYERILETRLILSQDFGATNVAFNWINESDLRRGGTDFGYAMGVMRLLDPEGHEGHSGGHHEHGMSFSLGGLGLEAYGGLGNQRKLDLRPNRQEHYMGPVVMFHLGHERMLHLGVAKGLSKTSDPLLVRFALSIEF